MHATGRAPALASAAPSARLGGDNGLGAARIRAGPGSLRAGARAAADAAARAAGETPRPLRRLRVDGGASANGLLMQIQADALGLPVSRPANVETTALGAALAAGVGAGLWREEDIFADASDVSEDGTLFQAATDAATREARYAKWADAVERSLGLA